MAVFVMNFGGLNFHVTRWPKIPYSVQRKFLGHLESSIHLATPSHLAGAATRVQPAAEIWYCTMTTKIQGFKGRLCNIKGKLGPFKAFIPGFNSIE